MTKVEKCYKSNDFKNLIDKYNASKIKDLVYYILFSIVYVRAFYYTTMFTELVQNNRIINLVGYGAAGCLLIMAMMEIITLIIDKDTKTALLFLSLLCIGCISALESSDRGIIVLCVLLIASVDKDMKIILRISIVLGIAMMIAAYLASMCGFVSYLVYDKARGELYHAFGCVYRTDFAAHIMYITMSYLWLRKDRITSLEYAGAWFLAWFCWRYAGAKNDVFCIFLLLVSFIFLKLYWYRKHVWPRFAKWSCLIHIICSVGIIISILRWGKIDDKKLIEGTETLLPRFYLSLGAIRSYGLSLFGKVVEERGAGGIPDINKTYFFLDIAYVRILIKYGILFLLVYLVLMTMNSYYAAVSGDAVLVLILSVIAINSLVEHHAIDVCYNVFLLTGMTSMGIKKRNKREGYI